jgi:hypothetical protein
MSDTTSSARSESHTDREQNGLSSVDESIRSSASSGSSTSPSSSTSSNEQQQQQPKKRRKKKAVPKETYVYRDFANVEPGTLVKDKGVLIHEVLLPKNLQSQKLPAKLDAMLSDPGAFIVHCVTHPSS